MPLNQKYRKSNEVLVNYDFADILSNVGYVTVYGVSDSANTKTLSRLPLASADYYTVVNGATAGSPTSTEVNFDYTFNSSQLVKGKLFVTETYEATDSGADVTAYTKVRILHYDGTTENVIGAQQTTDDLNVSTGTQQFITTLTFDINKHFKRGEMLRIEIELWVASANTNSNSVLYHDGSNRDFGLESPTGVAVGSQLICLMPFDLGGKL